MRRPPLLLLMAAACLGDLGFNETETLSDAEDGTAEAPAKDSSLLASLRDLMMRRVVRRPMRKPPMRRAVRRAVHPIKVRHGAAAAAVSGGMVAAAVAHEDRMQQVVLFSSCLAVVCLLGCLWHCVQVHCDYANHGVYSGLPGGSLRITPRTEAESPRVMQLTGGMRNKPANWRDAWKKKFQRGQQPYRMLGAIPESEVVPESLRSDKPFATHTNLAGGETERLKDSPKWNDDGSDMVC